MRMEQRNLQKIVAICVCIFVTIALGIELSKELLVNHLRDNPRSVLHKNHAVKWFLYDVCKTKVSYPNKVVAQFISAEFSGVEKRVDLLKDAETEWDIQVIRVMSGGAEQIKMEFVDTLQLRITLKKLGFLSKVRLSGLVCKSGDRAVVEKMYARYPQLYEFLRFVHIDELKALGVVEGEIPVTLILDAKGMLVYKKTGRLSVADTRDIEALYKRLES
jgi:hypothetical protein